MRLKVHGFGRHWTLRNGGRDKPRGWDRAKSAPSPVFLEHVKWDKWVVVILCSKGVTIISRTWVQAGFTGWVEWVEAEVQPPTFPVRRRPQVEPLSKGTDGRNIMRWNVSRFEQTLGHLHSRMSGMLEIRKILKYHQKPKR